MTMGGGIRGLASGTAIYGVGEVLSRAVGFLLLPLLTAYLTPADFGISSMLAALTFLLTPLFSLGMGAAIAPAYFHRPDTGHKAAVIGTTVAILSASVVVMLVAGVATAPLMSDLSFQTGAYARLVVLAVLGAAFTILTIPFRQYFQFEQRVRAYVALSTCSALVTAAVTVWAVVGLGRGILGFIEATVIGQAFTFAIFLTIASRRVNLSVDWAIGRDLLRLGLPMIPAFGSIFFMQHGSKYLLQRLGSLDDVGIYTIGLNVGLVISVLVTGFQSAWVRYFMSFADRQDEARIQLGRVANVLRLQLRCGEPGVVRRRQVGRIADDAAGVPPSLARRGAICCGTVPERLLHRLAARHVLRQGSEVHRSHSGGCRTDRLVDWSRHDPFFRSIRRGARAHAQLRRPRGASVPASIACGTMSM